MPLSSSHLGEVGLPKLVWGGRRIGEAIGRLHQDEGRACDAYRRALKGQSGIFAEPHAGIIPLKRRSDEKAHTFTLCRADNYWQFAYSFSRFEKITAGRYAEWRLVVPPEFEMLAKEHDHRRHWYQDYVTGEWCSKGSDMGKNLLKPKERLAAHQ